MRGIWTTSPRVSLQRWTPAAEQWGSVPDTHVFPVSHTPGWSVYRTGKRRLPLCHLAPWSHLVVALPTLPRTVTRRSLTLEIWLVVCGFSGWHGSNLKWESCFERCALLPSAGRRQNHQHVTSSVPKWEGGWRGSGEGSVFMRLCTIMWTTSSKIKVPESK